jgi:hypothetical protein
MERGDLNVSRNWKLVAKLISNRRLVTTRKPSGTININTQPDDSSPKSPENSGKSRDWWRWKIRRSSIVKKGLSRPD